MALNPIIFAGKVVRSFLRYQLLTAAGFGEGVWGRQVQLEPVIGTTTPDVAFVPPDAEEDEAVHVYLDGLSGHLHGNPATAEHDRVIRTWLRNHGHEVLEIAVSDLSDAGAISRLETTSRSQEGFPGRPGVFRVGRAGRLPRGIDGKDDADGPATMGHDVGRLRLSNATEDAVGSAPVTGGRRRGTSDQHAAIGRRLPGPRCCRTHPP